MVTPSIYRAAADMADFGSPVAQDVNSGNGLQSLSQIMQLRSQQLAIQGQQQGLQGQAAQVQQEQQNARQRANTATFMQNFDPAKHVGADGTLDLDGVFSDPKLRQAAGDQFPELMQHLLQVKQAQLIAKQSLVDLNNSTRTQFQQMLGGLRTDPDVIADNPQGRQKVQTAVGQFAATGPDAARVAQIYGTVTQAAPHGKLAQALSNMQLQAEDAGTQAAHQAPNFVNTGAEAVNVNPQAAGGNLTTTPAVKMSIPPGMSTFTDQAGNTWAVNPQTPGHAILVGHGGGMGTQQPASAASSTPGAPPIMAVGGTQNATQSAVNDEQTYSQIRNAANKAPITKNILSSIETLAGESKTGVGSKDLANAESVISQYVPGFKAAGDAATNRQLLGKYVEQLALQTAEGAGASTDQARATVASAIPDPDHMTPEAMQKAARFIQSQTQIAQARGAVAEKYRAEHGGSSQGLRAVDSAFMQNVDPRAFDFMSLPKDQRAQYLQQNFPDPAARAKFANELSVIDHYGGFNYAKQ